MEHNHAESPVLAVLRALLYLGVFSLVGTGVFARWVGMELAVVQRRVLSGWLLLGGLMVLFSSLYLVYHTLWMLSPGLIWELLPAYLLESQQGTLVLVRLLLTVALAVLLLGSGQLWERMVHAGLSLGVLATLTFTAHAGAGGAVAIASDLVHLTLNTAWAGSVLALAVAWTVARPELLEAVRRLSLLGGVAVAGFWVSGILLGLGHLNSLNELGSSYGQAVLRKLMVVLLIMGVAALNRWALLPQIKKQIPGLALSPKQRLSYEATERVEWLGWLVRLEATLLLGVLGASGILASTPPPNQGKAAAGLYDVRFEEAYNGGKLSGQWFTNSGYIHLTVLIQEANGQVSKNPPLLKVQLSQEGQPELGFTVKPLAPNSAQYHEALPIPTPGRWEANLELDGALFSHQVDVPEGR
jgi:putative copper export protein